MTIYYVPAAIDQPYWDAIAAETEERNRRMEIRAAEQARLHALDPAKHTLSIPVDDDEFGTEAWTAGWSQEPGA